ncbi:hypothetical protein L602_001500000100 [Cupriavidus gilardii J11]|uniref:Uncharacterized protein n=1 Tax=Cupriavidus gilardii J11 TaxID=936133 RepID=A0A562BRN4_9BURK|nr:hypothetical protein [Cupriavidus gilardii]TWG87877.1 hypothetical protein L602_001500000100 [Cupriavidus gilardii J11]
MRTDATMDNRLFDRALDLVHRYCAASVALLQRGLQIDPEAAEAILQRMATETTFVRKHNGLYLYIDGPIGQELSRLHGFARHVLAAVESGSLDADRVRAAAVRFGLAEEVTMTERCGETCACATLFDFPVQCVRPAQYARAEYPSLDL